MWWYSILSICLTGTLLFFWILCLLASVPGSFTRPDRKPFIKYINNPFFVLFINISKYQKIANGRYLKNKIPGIFFINKYQKFWAVCCAVNPLILPLVPPIAWYTKDSGAVITWCPLSCALKLISSSS
jgi:hypothetical protein